MWAATLFKEALAARGIVIEGQPRHRDFRGADNEKIDPQHASELASVTSKSLAEIVAETNKRSNNLYAELILRTLGKERGVMVPVTDPSKRERGDDEAGLAVVKLWLERAGIHTNGLALHDGSGLSRLNLVTPAVIGHLLAAEQGLPPLPLSAIRFRLLGKMDARFQDVGYGWSDHRKDRFTHL